MAGNANYSQHLDGQPARMNAEIAASMSMSTMSSQHRPSGHIILHATKPMADKVIRVFEVGITLTAEEARARTGLKRIPKEAIRTLELLGYLQRVGGTKTHRYELTKTGAEYRDLGEQDARRYLLQSLNSNQNFAAFWLAYRTGRQDLSKRELSSYIEKTYSVSPTTASLYAGYALSFLRFVGLVVESKRSKFRFDVANGVDSGQGKDVRGPVAGPAKSPSHARAINEAYRLIARLGALLADKGGVFESAADRTSVLTWIDSLPGFTGQTTDTEILRIAKEEARAALTSKDAESLAFAIRYLHALVRKHDVEVS